MDIGLVLSGGGARCIAQLGALLAFEERDLHPVAISACSSAALLGALLASGKPPRGVAELAREVKWSELVSVQFGAGLLSSDGLGEWLAQHVPSTFEELTIPFVVVAVDIQNGELCEFRSGPLVPAALASNAFPGVFHPVRFNDRDLMDGGILNVVPVDVIQSLTHAPVIVLDASSSPKRRIDLDRKAGAIDLITKAFRKEMPLPIDLMYKAYVITRGHIVDELYRRHPPELVIRPPLDEAGIHDADFGKFEQALDLGYQEACRVLDEQLPALLTRHSA